MIFTDAEAVDLKVWVVKKLEDMYVFSPREPAIRVLIQYTDCLVVLTRTQTCSLTMSLL